MGEGGARTSRRRAALTALVLSAAAFAFAGASFSAEDVFSRLAGLRPTSRIAVEGGARVVLQGEWGDLDRAIPVLRRYRKEQADPERVGIYSVIDAGVVIDLAGADREAARAWIRGAMRQRPLEVRLVASGTDLMDAIAGRAERDPHAEELGISAEVDVWVHRESGIEHRDRYLTGPDRETLARYLKELVASDADLAPDEGLSFAFEEVIPQGDSPARRVRWRSYLLDERVWLTSEDFTEARVYFSKETNRPEILAEFTEEGGATFAALTGENAGRKFAILLDGDVVSAPIIKSEVLAGSTSITLGALDPEEEMREANALVEVLRSVPVGALEVERIEVVEAPSALFLQGARWLFALGIGVAVFLLGYFAARLAPPAVPQVRAAPPGERARRRFWVRLAVSALAVTAVVLGRQIQLPMLEIAPFETLSAGLDGTFFLRLFALGLLPILLAFLVVEVVALLVPRWRRLRNAGPSGRATLGAAVVVVTSLFAVAFAVQMADVLVESELDFVAGDAAWPRTTIALSLVGGTLALALCAHLIESRGVGSGYVLVMLALVAPTRPGLAGAALSEFLTTTKLALLILFPVLAAALASWALRARLGGYRLPTCGLIPILWIPALGWVAWYLTRIGFEEASLKLGLRFSENALALNLPVASLGVVLALSVGGSWLLSRPRERIPGARVLGGGGARGAFWKATAASAAILLVLAAAPLVLPAQPALGPSWLLQVAVWVPIATAAFLDLSAEIRALWRNGHLVRVWPIHRVQLVDAAVAELRRRGIDVHARGVHARTLFSFFGPFVPVVLMVPPESAAEAREALRPLEGAAHADR